MRKVSSICLLVQGLLRNAQLLAGPHVTGHLPFAEETSGRAEKPGAQPWWGGKVESVLSGCEGPLSFPLELSSRTIWGGPAPYGEAQFPRLKSEACHVPACAKWSCPALCDGTG